MSEVKAIVVRPFGDDEGFHRTGETVVSTAGRHAELVANGLVAIETPAAPAEAPAPVVENKTAAPIPENKMLPEPTDGTAEPQSSLVRKTK